jgi:hypothetical protein
LRQPDHVASTAITPDYPITVLTDQHKAFDLLGVAM